MHTHFTHIPLEQLQPGRYQPRQSFDPESLHALAQSIRTQGLLEPLIVRPLADDRYEIIAGERRFRALILAGFEDAPCMLGDYTDQQAATVTLIENIQREDLNLIEEASGYQRLIHEFHFHQDEVAALVSKSRSHVANILRLLNLCTPVQEHVRQRLLSLGHVRLLVSLSASKQQHWAQKILDNGWSVRQLEQAMRQISTAAPSELTPDLQRLESMLSEQIGSPVRIMTEKEQSGWVSIKFFDHDTLEGLLERIGLRYDKA